MPAVVACTTFGPVSPTSFIMARKPPDVWVIRADSSVIHLYRPKFLGDTLTGFVDGKYHTVQPRELQGVKARRPAPGRTVLLMVGGVSVVTLAAILVAGATEEVPVADSGGAQIVGVLP